MAVIRVRSLVLGAALVAAFAVVHDEAATAAADGCAAGVRTDFNGDSRGDTVVGDPHATVEGQAEAGRVTILYGDADGLVGEGSRGVIRQGMDSVGGVAESGDQFGGALAAADIDCDGFTDLVVGTRYEDINGQSDSGYAQIVFGSVAGLGKGAASRNLTQTNFGLPVVAGDQFGYAVDALEDVGQGGTPAPDAYAIAIGAPGADVAGRNDAGRVAFIAAVDGGSTSSTASQSTAGAQGTAEAGDRFGSAVSLNYLSGEDGLVDCAVGVPNEDVGPATDTGTVTIINDIYGAPENGGVGITQNFAGVPGAVEAGDKFGRSLDTVQVGTATRLAVGVPGKNVGSDGDAGVVQLFTSNGEVVKAGPSLSQDTASVTDTTESGDQFGDKVAWAAPGLGDSATRLAVSATNEDVAVKDMGMVQVFPITNLGAEKTYTQNTSGVPGTASASDRFGSSIAVVEGPTERVLVVGVPGDVTHAAGMVDVIPFAGGTPREWRPGISGIPAGGASLFGAALAGVTG